MTTYSSKPGFSEIRSYRSRRYPFELLGVGEMLDPPFPMADLARVKFAMKRWNDHHPDRILAINSYPKGSDELKEPHFVVGRTQPPVGLPETTETIS